MAIYGCTNIIPNGISIDATTNNTILWQYQGTTPQTHYQIIIYLNSNNSIIFNSTKLSGENTNHIVPANTLINGNIYKIQIQTFSGVDSARSSWVLFFCDALPTLTIGTLPTDVQQFLFTANYNSAQSIPVLTYEFILYNSLSIQISTSGTVYPSTLTFNNSNPLTHLFDGLESSKSYYIECTCINQRGVELTTGLHSFSITYQYPDSIPSLIMTADHQNATITIDWTALKQILGVVNGTYSYVSGKFGQGLRINTNSNLYYNTEHIPIEHTIYYWLKITHGYNGVLVKLSDNINDNLGMQVTFHTDRFGFDFGEYSTVGRKLTNTELTEIENNFILIGIQYGKVIIKSNTFQEIISMV